VQSPDVCSATVLPPKLWVNHLIRTALPYFDARYGFLGPPFFGSQFYFRRRLLTRPDRGNMSDELRDFMMASQWLFRHLPKVTLICHHEILWSCDIGTLPLSCLSPPQCTSALPDQLSGKIKAGDSRLRHKVYFSYDFILLIAVRKMPRPWGYEQTVSHTSKRHPPISGFTGIGNGMG